MKANPPPILRTRSRHKILFFYHRIHLLSLAEQITRRAPQWSIESSFATQQLLPKPLKSNELLVLTRLSLQRCPCRREQDSNFLSLFEKKALTRPSSQRFSCIWLCGLSGVYGLFHILRCPALQFFQYYGLRSAMLFGSHAYWPDNQDRWQVFAAASSPFSHVDIQFSCNIADC